MNEGFAMDLSKKKDSPQSDEHFCVLRVTAQSGS